MSYTSPFTNPQPYISKMDGLSSEGITIDEGIDRAARQAADFASKYSGNFSAVNELKDATASIKERWTEAFSQSRDAASSVSAWILRFSEVYLSMLNMIQSSADAKDVVTEFNSFLGEEYPSKKYQLDNTPGPKGAFEEIEGLAAQDSKHIIEVLEAQDWEKGLEELKQSLPSIQDGVQQIRNALNSYATKLST